MSGLRPVLHPRHALRLAMVLACSLLAPAQAAEPVRFAALDIWLEAPAPVAAWQFELRDGSAAMQVVGVEGGDSAAYPDAPYYDRDAVAAGVADRIVVADYSLEPASRLPRGRTRVATVHVMLPAAAEPDFQLILVTATTHDGRPLDAALGFAVRQGSAP
ncbi:MAG TPA: hypothetical protein VFY03_00595 [Woeseiaceae bacterium]|nr:hypothetical protein [Woeseiaceae bacterium]